MQFLDFMRQNGHKELAVWVDNSVGFKAFIAIHDTRLGPALGGTRIWPYSDDETAIMDVLRLSQAMTYKSAAAGLNLGGGKGLIMADSGVAKNEQMMRSYGRFVDSLAGAYITTEDVGATAEDMHWISMETDYVVGLPEELGGSGNPAGVTGFGVYHAMRAAARVAWGSEELSGKTVAMQGFGNVANSLAGYLLEDGARLVVTDINQTARERATKIDGISVVDPDAIFDTQCDVFAPCALGSSVNEITIPRLSAKIVCGAANNQLLTSDDCTRLSDAGILYVPDFVANAGGVINVSFELNGEYDESAAKTKASEIYGTTVRVLQMAENLSITTEEAAKRIAEERLTSHGMHGSDKLRG